MLYECDVCKSSCKYTKYDPLTQVKSIEQLVTYHRLPQADHIFVDFHNVLHNLNYNFTKTEAQCKYASFNIFE